eukprot:36952-Pelagomonas_calceolata.AAC.1
MVMVVVMMVMVVVMMMVMMYAARSKVASHIFPLQYTQPAGMPPRCKQMHSTPSFVRAACAQAPLLLGVLHHQHIRRDSSDCFQVCVCAHAAL